MDEEAPGASPSDVESRDSRIRGISVAKRQIIYLQQTVRGETLDRGSEMRTANKASCAASTSASHPVIGLDELSASSGQIRYRLSTTPNQLAIKNLKSGHFALPVSSNTSVCVRSLTSVSVFKLMASTGKAQPTTLGSRSPRRGQAGFVVHLRRGRSKRRSATKSVYTSLGSTHLT